MMDERSYASAIRFGLGVKPGDEAPMGSSTDQWLIRQLNAPQGSPAFASLPRSQQQMQSLLKMRQAVKDGVTDKKEAQKALRGELKDIFIEELRARIALAAMTDTPFYERLVNFWSNHFSVSVKKPQLAGIAGAFEREAIRPHITGKFAELLIAVTRHPAMLIYLDNAQSVGPSSLAGERRGKGLNENLAREIMELHTLGVEGGYTQGDVTSFAKILTGWSIAPLEAADPGGFGFAARRHEPGVQYIMGRAYPDDGEAQGMAVLRNLALNQATAHHIATKLARHFIADDPPQDIIRRLAGIFLDTGGDLSALYAGIIQSEEAWDLRGHPKIKNSYDLIISAMRAGSLAGEAHVNYALKSLKFLGDAPFTAPSPAGFADSAQDIAGPDAMIRRVEWAQMAAVQLSTVQPAAVLGTAALGPFLSPGTREAILSAKNQGEATAILFGSPDFQRR